MSVGWAFICPRFQLAFQKQIWC